MDLISNLGGAALSGLQLGGQMAMAVGGAAGGAMSAGLSSVGKTLGGEASFFDETVTVRGAQLCARARARTRAAAASRLHRPHDPQPPLPVLSRRILLRPRCAPPCRTKKSSTCWTTSTPPASRPWLTRSRA